MTQIDEVRKFCLSLPGATEGVQWGNDLLFRVADKMFAVAALDAAASVRLSFKCSPEDFAELTERDGIIPAPYLARAQWVGLERWDALPRRELLPLLEKSYKLVLARLPKKKQQEISGAERPAMKAKKSSAAGKVKIRRKKMR